MRPLARKFINIINLIDITVLTKRWPHISRELFKEGSFVQNAAWMFSSSGISIVLQFVFFYLLSKIYSPADYGLFGVFNVYAATLGNLASFGYNQAFVLPKEQDKFKHLLHMTIAVSSIVCLLFALTMCFLGSWTLSILGHQQLGWYIHLVAPIAWLMAMDRITADWAIRVKSFKNQMWTSVAATVGSRSYNLCHGLWIGPDALGLIITTALQHCLRIILYLRFVITDSSIRWWRQWNYKGMLDMAKTYLRYPTYVHWSNVLVIFSAGLPPALLPIYGYALSDLGYYVHALVLLDIPIRLMGAGIASVFTQKAAEIMRDRPEALRPQSLQLYRYILGLSLVFLFIVLVFGEWGYAFVFGSSWQSAGSLAEVLVLYFFFRMISSPLSALFYVLKAEKQNFYFHLSLTIARLLCLWWAASAHLDFLSVMCWYALVNALFYLIYIALILQLIRGSHWIWISRTLALTVGVMIAAAVLRLLLFGDMGPLMQWIW
jgi:O-antigen/teichoic acid export membrane protein